MTEIAFTETEVPTVAYTRASEPNPFADVVQRLADSMGDDERSVSATTFTVPQADEKKMVGKAQEAGRDIGVTVRKKVEILDEDSANPQARITIWTTKRITRPRKNKSAADKADGKASNK